jgi:oxygen-independent coproporphyrinogen III oxidase
MARHLYLHIPFCQRRCAYCDFNTYANMEDRMAAYVDALCQEIRQLREWWLPQGGSGAGQAGALADRGGGQSPFTRAALRPTVFLGGGTPSMLPLDLMARVLEAANSVVALEGAEVTVEANPGTELGRGYLEGLRALGVNRLSMGVQSLDDPTLRVLGRTHSAADALRSYADARAAGFDNINLDFIFGLPGQTPARWERTLGEITRWGVDHFSLYSLILEEKTPLYAQVTSGRVSVPDDDATAAMYEAAMAAFADAGYAQYEISNWTREKPCHHNLAYWLNADYLAAGAGAHGHVFPRRYADVLGIDEYIAAVRRGARPVADVSELDAADLAAETMFMGLRLNAGVGYAHFRERTGRALEEVYGAVLDGLVGQGLVARGAEGVRLTARGRMFGNQVFQQFV